MQKAETGKKVRRTMDGLNKCIEDDCYACPYRKLFPPKCMDRLLAEAAELIGEAYQEDLMIEQMEETEETQ